MKGMDKKMRKDFCQKMYLTIWLDIGCHDLLGLL
jgi:hypothetical protein